MSTATIGHCIAEHADTIRSVMSNISLPESCFPPWASVIPESEWKAKLVSQLSASDNVATGSAQDSNSVSADCTCRQDTQDISSG